VVPFFIRKGQVYCVVLDKNSIGLYIFQIQQFENERDK